MTVLSDDKSMFWQSVPDLLTLMRFMPASTPLARSAAPDEACTTQHGRLSGAHHRPLPAGLLCPPPLQAVNCNLIRSRLSMRLLRHFPRGHIYQPHVSKCVFSRRSEPGNTACVPEKNPFAFRHRAPLAVPHFGAHFLIAGCARPAWMNGSFLPITMPRKIHYFIDPNTFLRMALPVPTGSCRIFFSSSPMIRYRPSSDLPVTYC